PMRVTSAGAGLPDVLRTSSRSSSMPLSGLAALRWQDTVIGVTSAKISSGSTATAELLCKSIRRRQSGSGMKTPRDMVCAAVERVMGLEGIIDEGSEEINRHHTRRSNFSPER